MNLREIYKEWIKCYFRKFGLEDDEYILLGDYISSRGFFEGIVDAEELSESSGLYEHRVITVFEQLDTKGLINYHDGRIDNRSLDTMLAKACSLTKLTDYLNY